MAEPDPSIIPVHLRPVFERMTRIRRVILVRENGDHRVVNVQEVHSTPEGLVVYVEE